MTDIEPLTGTTAGGLPWPATTDPLNQGANDIKALAAALEARGHGIRVESRAVSVTTAGGIGTIAFAKSFPSVPVAVLITMAAPFGTSSQAFTYAVFNAPTAANFQVAVYQVAPSAAWYAGAVTIHYTAWGPA